MKRIIASVLAAALLLLPLCSCSSVQHIEDTNGAEDTSLCTLTEEELVSPHPKCLTQGSSISHYKNMVYFLPLKMSGVKTLDKFEKAMTRYGIMSEDFSKKIKVVRTLATKTREVARAESEDEYILAQIEAKKAQDASAAKQTESEYAPSGKRNFINN